MGKFEEHVVIDGNLFTGQNPPSAGKLAQAVIYRFDPIKAEFEPERFSLLKEREAEGLRGRKKAANERIRRSEEESFVSQNGAYVSRLAFHPSALENLSRPGEPQFLAPAVAPAGARANRR